MTAGTPSGSGQDQSDRFRRIFLGLAAATIVGTAAELASLRHWDGTDQLIPWVTLAILATAVVVQWLRPTPTVTLASRVIGGACVAAGLFGAWEHIHSNYETALLDFRYANTWATMSALDRWWTAASGGVGPSPALAPMILALSGLCLVFATVGLPAGRRSDQEVSAGAPATPAEVSS